MLFGGPVLLPFNSPEEWVKNMQDLNFTACVFPLDHTAKASEIDAYVAAAKAADIVIAEVGAWKNQLSPNAAEAKVAMQYAKDQLSLADYIGARCCVNIAGSKNPNKWDSHHKDNWTCFDEIVVNVRDIIDSVKPTKTYYTIETMPWIFPYNADTYLDLIKAIDRERFGAHLDLVNIIKSPYEYYHNADITRECFAKLGKYIKSVHAKDNILHDKLTVHIDEMPPGQGNFDFTVLFECMKELPDVPVLMEHMHEHEVVKKAGEYLRGLM